MVIITSRLFVVVVVVVATLPSSFVAFTTKLRVVVIIFFWECDDVLRSKDVIKLVVREFNKDDFGTQGDAFMSFDLCVRYVLMRLRRKTTRVKVASFRDVFWCTVASYILRKTLNYCISTIETRETTLCHLRDFDENNENKNKNNNR